MKGRLLFRPDEARVYKRLVSVAESGNYNKEVLDSLRQSPSAGGSKELYYFFASLYLQLGEYSIAKEILSECGSATRAMKRFYHVLNFSRARQLPIPRLTQDETRCLDFLDSAINPTDSSFESVLLNKGAFTVVGNAPGPTVLPPIEGLRIYFNGYASNKRITEKADAHVVTPSWDESLTNGTDVICITGNDIFYRRSRVWQRFIDSRHYKAIYTAPRSIWCSLYQELGTSPSAGLLMLSWVEAVSVRNPNTLQGHVAGFSKGIPLVNHDYDSAPVFKGHNWEAEAVVRDRVISSLKSNCASFEVEA